jgi:hypothetical protein
MCRRLHKPARCHPARCIGGHVSTGPAVWTREGFPRADIRICDNVRNHFVSPLPAQQRLHLLHSPHRVDSSEPDCDVGAVPAPLVGMEPRRHQWSRDGDPVPIENRDRTLLQVGVGHGALTSFCVRGTLAEQVLVVL